MSLASLLLSLKFSTHAMPEMMQVGDTLSTLDSHKCSTSRRRLYGTLYYLINFS